MRYVFIINSAAGKGKSAIELERKIEHYFRKNPANHSIVMTEYANHATDAARIEAAKGDEVVIFACGGDGTTFEVLNGLVGYNNAIIGIIPCGTANDFIKYFGDASAFSDIEAQVDGTSFPIDLIKFEDKFAINQCSAGMDAMVAANVSKFKRLPISGSTAYKFSVVYTFFSRLNMKLKISIDNRELRSVNTLFAVCANAPYYGGGYKSAPTAIPGDGKLEFSIIETSSKLKIVSLLGHYRKGTHINLPNCHYGNCQVMEIESDRSIPINLDGEIVYRSKVKFEILKKGTRLMIPSIIANRLEDDLSATSVNISHSDKCYAETDIR